jgi:hypothetical protein
MKTLAPAVMTMTSPSFHTGRVIDTISSNSSNERMVCITESSDRQDMSRLSGSTAGSPQKEGGIGISLTSQLRLSSYGSDPFGPATAAAPVARYVIV